LQPYSIQINLLDDAMITVKSIHFMCGHFVAMNLKRCL